MDWSGCTVQRKREREGPLLEDDGWKRERGRENGIGIEFRYDQASSILGKSSDGHWNLKQSMPLNFWINLRFFWLK